MAVVTASERHAWWLELRHGGMLMSPPVLHEFFAEDPEPLDRAAYPRLRDRYTVFGSWLEQHGVAQGPAAPLHGWLDAVLEEFLGYSPDRWVKGSAIPTELSVQTAFGERLRPARLLYSGNGKSQPSLAVWVDRVPRIGMHRGRVGYSKLLEWLRASGLKLGLLTNGSQFRLCYAGLDTDSWVEWEAESWFSEIELREQLAGFKLLLGSVGTAPRNGWAFPLLEAVEASRTRQGELSTVMGEQVRQAVELLAAEIDRVLRQHPDFLDVVRRQPGTSEELSQKRVLDVLYQAACRLVMRMVVILFAEARGMLPRSLASYNSSYGMEGLFELLKRAVAHEGPRSLDDHSSAWPRLLSLFRLVHDGSHHPTLPVPAYGGVLFRPGRPEDPDPVLRAVAVFEDQRLSIRDSVVYDLLRKLKVGAVKVRRGRSSSWVNGLVDFSQLRTEYIGMMYEGLLDYQLKATDRTIVFLNLGHEPVLPLDILEDLPDRNVRDLIDKLSKDKAQGPVTGEAEEEDESEETAEEESEAVEDAGEPELGEESIEAADEEETGTEPERERAHQWALRAVEAARLVRKPRGRRAQHEYYYEQERQKAARGLVKRVLQQGELYLARWGGTRKGSGTFYTKPGLSVPTVHRTLEPLAYDKDESGRLIPKTPEEILALKVCDPACGSGSFPVAALHYLTEALYDSLQLHRGLGDPERKQAVTLPFGQPASAQIDEETPPVPATDDRFQAMVKARLKRHVVERCIYGVDLNPMAVELCRLSLWIETMDQELPFGFLDHKIKVGNSLVGAWFDRFQDYPLCAWLREGGDKNHTNGVHFEQNEWTKAIKQVLNDQVKPELVELITGQLPLAHAAIPNPAGVHDEAMVVFEKLHSLPVSAEGIAERERVYREEVLGNPALRHLKDAFDTWCALWFWPADQLDLAPTPGSFYQLSEEQLAMVHASAAEHRFFHWELEFPDVFARPGSGFDAMVGNPPWDVQKPNSKEFFSSHDPIYRTYGKQEAIRHQTRLFEADKEIERDWVRYCATFRGMSNWCASVATPFGHREEGQSVSLHKSWRRSWEYQDMWRSRRAKRAGYSDPYHPFRHQGSADINSYKMFVEMFHGVLRDGGRLGIVTPSSTYTDEGATALRTLFLDHCQWEWLLIWPR